MPLTTDPEVLRAWVRLSLEPGVGPVAAAELMTAFGDPQALFATPPDILAAHLPADLAQRLGAPAADDTRAGMDAALSWAAAADRHLLTLADERYPPSLRDMHDPPPVLYVVGDPAHLHAPMVAIVGARHATPGGSGLARDFAQALAAQGWTIASGLALGIDGDAHQGALLAEGGTTVAVIGTGADLVYPARHRALAHEIAARGCLVSELPLGTPARPHHFPRRNRLVAALSQGVLVVEAAVHSGSLITARLAADMGREVFAIPGSVHSPLARGCHALIRQGAKLVETAADVVEELGAPRPIATTPPTASARPAPDDLLDAMGFDPLDFDQIQARADRPAAHVLARLLALELDGCIARLPGNRFQRLT